MDQAALAVIAALALLQVKHVLCDYFLQSQWQLETKGIYGHPGGFVHAGLHALGTLPIFLIFPVHAGVVIAFLAAEFIAHYHIDWLKSRANKHFGWKMTDRPFWWAVGFDQFVHQMTYLLMVLVLLMIDN